MNKKMLLGALVGAGISMLNKKIRQQPVPRAGTPPPDFSKVPPPQTGNTPGGGPGLDDILARAGKPGGLGGSQPGGGASGGDIFGDASAPGAGLPSGAGLGAGAGGAAVLMEMARRILAQMQQQQGGGVPSGQQAPGGMPGGGLSEGDLGAILGQIFGRAGGKFGPQDAQTQGKPGGAGGGLGGLFGFADNTASGGDQQADIMLQAMIAAAQSDGRIDETEQQNIVRALDGQLDSGDLEAFRKMLGEPVNVDQMLDKVQDPATAFNLYLVSAMSIDQNNPAEKTYMDSLASKLGISEQAAQVIEQQVPRR